MIGTSIELISVKDLMPNIVPEESWVYIIADFIIKEVSLCVKTI